jgi:hypothetical protein
VLWSKDGSVGKGKSSLEKGCECEERFGERMGVWGKVRVLWKKDGNVEKDKSSLEKGWECRERHEFFGERMGM